MMQNYEKPVLFPNICVLQGLQRGKIWMIQYHSVSLHAETPAVSTVWEVVAEDDGWIVSVCIPLGEIDEKHNFPLLSRSGQFIYSVIYDIISKIL